MPFKDTLALCLIWLLLVPSSKIDAFYDDTNNNQARAHETLGLSIFREIGQASLEPIVKKVAEELTKPLQTNDAMKALIKIVAPKLVTTTTAATTTTAVIVTTDSPIDDLTKTIIRLPANLPKSGLLDGPAKVLNSMIATSINIGQAGTDTVDDVADQAIKVSEATGKAAVGLSESTLQEAPESDDAYYEDIEDEPENHRKPKYFSRECSFRIACEIGKTVRPMTVPVYKLVERNKIIQNLQNRYTRALTYGVLHNECSRYYCFFVQLMGGQAQFASGIAELIKRVSNPGLYER